MPYRSATASKRRPASALDDPPMMGVDGGIDQIAAQPSQPRQCAILIRPREPKRCNRQYRRPGLQLELARFPHGAPFGRHSK